MIDYNSYKSLMNTGTKVFFLGIGGISMSGLAELALASQMVVAGSDANPNARCQQLKSAGATIFPQHESSNIDKFCPQVVVYSAAVGAANPERRRAAELGLPCLERSAWLGLLNREYEQVINIAGTNGKSTTTALTALIALAAQLDPCIHVGAVVKELANTVRPSQTKKLMISEACEFHNSFHCFHSSTQAVLNIAHDHTDCFPTLDDVIVSFGKFILNLPVGGKLVLPSFDPLIPQLLAYASKCRPDFLQQVELYSFGYEGQKIGGQEVSLYASELELGQNSRFRLSFQGEDLGYFTLAIPGKFNLENALAAILLAHLNGADFESARKVCASFTGVDGRFTYAGYYNGACLIQDYAHHPDSLRLTLEAAHQLPQQKLYACFQPITYSRARSFCADYAEILGKEEQPILLEVFDDREQDCGFSFQAAQEMIKANGGAALFFPTPAALEHYLKGQLQPGDLALFIGQSIRQVATNLAQSLC